MEYLFIFLIGVCVGSFLNVCIYRIPSGQSIVFPRSFCPFCKTPIKWFDNIPVLSFLLLKGKCRKCAHKIPVKYPLVELFTALGGLLFYYFYGASASFVIYWIFYIFLLVASVVDIEKQIIPDIISLGGAVVAVISVTLFRVNGAERYLDTFLWSVSGGALGFILMLALALAGQLVFKKEALGGGDVKLMVLIGVFLGWKKVLLTFFVAPFFGAFMGLYLKIKYGKEIVPYGPYLALGALISLLFGDNILNYLFNY